MVLYPEIHSCKLIDEFDSTINDFGERLKTLEEKRVAICTERQTILQAKMFMEGLRRGVSVPVFMGAGELNHWLFVKHVEIQLVNRKMQISDLDCVVIPEVLQPQARYELPPGKTHGKCENVIYTPDMLANETVAKLTHVEIGTWRDVAEVPCDVCGKNALVVCNRTLDIEVDWLEVMAGVLCMHCPRFMESARNRTSLSAWDFSFLANK